MRACASCGHANADQLAYCFGCGRRVRPLGAFVPAPAIVAAASGGAVAVAMGEDTTVAEFAATMAIDPLRIGAELGPPRTRNGLVRAYDAARYVFTTIRGRLDAEERRRQLLREAEGAKRMAEGTLVEIGQTVLIQNIAHAQLDPLRESAAQLKTRRDAVASDLAAAEKFRATEDLRLGLLEATAEGEWKACADSAREAEQALGRVEADRRAAKEELALHDAARVSGTPAKGERGSLSDRCAALDEQYRTLRERAAALRASSLGSKSKLENAAAARKQAASAVAASITGHARERGDLDAELRDVTSQIGARAVEHRVPSPFLAPAFGRLDRLRASALTQQNEIARLERSRGGVDRTRFAAGLGLILCVLGACSAGLWALLR